MNEITKEDINASLAQDLTLVKAQYALVCSRLESNLKELKSIQERAYALESENRALREANKTFKETIHAGEIISLNRVIGILSRLSQIPPSDWEYFIREDD